MRASAGLFVGAGAGRAPWLPECLQVCMGAGRDTASSRTALFLIVRIQIGSPCVAGGGTPSRAAKGAQVLTLRPESWEETHVLKKQETSVGKGPWGREQKGKEPGRTALPPGSKSGFEGFVVVVLISRLFLVNH